MKYISICSGIEAATTAWHGLGWEPLAFSEIEPFPSAVLAHHYPDVPNLGDMSKYREWPEELLVECDLLVGGTPCQAFSVAGLRKSLDDERGNLSLVYVHLFHHINEVRKRHGRSPAIALWENVPGVLSTKDNAFGCFISGLLGVDETLETEDGKWPKAGFLGSEAVRVGYRILDAQYFAVAQRRRRVFLVAVPCELVASLGERACPSEILSLRESVLGNPPTRGEARQAVAGTIAGCSNGGGANAPGRTADDADTLVVSCPQTANTLTRRMHKGINTTVDEGQTPIITGHPYPAYAISAGQQGKGGVFGSGRDSQDTFAVVPFTKSKRAQSVNDDESWVPGEVGDTRATTVVAFRENTRSEVQYVDPPHALTSGGGKPGQGYCGIQEGMQVRRLTPTECCRLQGFPDDHCDITFRKKPAADGPKYRALGNSMAVPCMAWLGFRIALATRQDKTGT